VEPAAPCGLALAPHCTPCAGVIAIWCVLENGARFVWCATCASFEPAGQRWRCAGPEARTWNHSAEHPAESRCLQPFPTSNA